MEILWLMESLQDSFSLCFQCRILDLGEEVIVWTELSLSWKADSIWKLRCHLNWTQNSDPSLSLDRLWNVYRGSRLIMEFLSTPPSVEALNVLFLLAHIGARASWHVVPMFLLITTHSFPSREVISKEDISSGRGDDSWGDWLPCCCLRPLFSTKFPVKLIHGHPGLDCLFLWYLSSFGLWGPLCIYGLYQEQRGKLSLLGMINAFWVWWEVLYKKCWHSTCKA